MRPPSQSKFIDLNSLVADQTIDMSPDTIAIYLYDKSNTEHWLYLASTGTLIQDIKKSFALAPEKSNWSCKVVGNVTINQDLVSSLSSHFDVKKTISRKDHFQLRFNSRLKTLQISKANENQGQKTSFKKTSGHSLSTTTKEDSTQPLKVLVIDDSGVIRSLISKMLNESEKFVVVGAAYKPEDIEKILKESRPDVVTLDLHMPVMSGIDILNKFLVPMKIPAIIVSAMSMEEGPMVLDALAAGAVDYIQKPSLDSIENTRLELFEKLTRAARAKTQVSSSLKRRTFSLQLSANVPILIGSSTGGTTAVETILKEFPKEVPPILIIQHIPPVFSKAFADRLNSVCKFPVKEAEPGEIIMSGTAYVAPGGKQLSIQKTDNHNFRMRITETSEKHSFVPSIDHTFLSAAQIGMLPVVAAILTGMGADGANGLLALKNKGAKTIAQDESTSVVFGMPQKAIELGAAENVCPLDEIAEVMASLNLSLKSKSKAA